MCGKSMISVSFEFRVSTALVSGTQENINMLSWDHREKDHSFNNIRNSYSVYAAHESAT